jgi:ferrous iron transport protein B
LTILTVLITVGYLSSKIIPGEGSDFILEIPPLRIPQFSNLLIKTIARIEWYLKEAVPLFIIGTIILFFFHHLGILNILEQITKPLIVYFLNLPSKVTEAFIIGFLRRDYGAAGLYILAKEGKLNPHQILVSLVTITLFIPCIAQFFMMIKERGLKTTIYISLVIFPIAFGVGGGLNFLLKIFGL